MIEYPDCELSEDEKTYCKEDREYIINRNLLIPDALRMTKDRMRHYVKRQNLIKHTREHDDLWDKIFLECMDQLARKEGII